MAHIPLIYFIGIDQTGRFLEKDSPAQQFEHIRGIFKESIKNAIVIKPQDYASFVDDLIDDDRLVVHGHDQHFTDTLTRARGKAQRLSESGTAGSVNKVLAIGPFVDPQYQDFDPHVVLLAQQVFIQRVHDILATTGQHYNERHLDDAVTTGRFHCDIKEHTFYQKADNKEYRCTGQSFAGSANAVIEDGLVTLSSIGSIEVDAITAFTVEAAGVTITADGLTYSIPGVHCEPQLLIAKLYSAKKARLLEKRALEMATIVGASDDGQEKTPYSLRTGRRIA